jgi:hypothetical protein
MFSRYSKKYILDLRNAKGSLLFGILRKYLQATTIVFRLGEKDAESVDFPDPGDPWIKNQLLSL